MTVHVSPNDNTARVKAWPNLPVKRSDASVRVDVRWPPRAPMPAASQPQPLSATMIFASSQSMSTRVAPASPALSTSSASVPSRRILSASA